MNSNNINSFEHTCTEACVHEEFLLDAKYVLMGRGNKP